MAGTLTPSEQRRAGLLVIAKRRAGGLLVLVAVVFGLSTAFLGRAHWLGWIQATAVASLVGGLADWFAVTALFRRPLGLPIPHTAIVVERKDRFAATLGAFVQESFLTPAAVSDRLRTSRAVDRLAGWLSDPDRAADLAGRTAEGLVAAADLLRDEDVHGVLDALVRQRVDKVALAPLAGRTLRQLTRDGRHNALIDAGLTGLSRYLGAHGAELHHRLGVHSPWWLPGPVEERMVERLLQRSRQILDDMAAHPDHPLRHQLEAGLVKLAEDLQTSEEMRRRGEELKAELLGQPQIRDFATAVWRDTKDQLRTQSARPGSELRSRLAELIVQTGVRLRDDPDLAASAQRSLDAVARMVLGRFDTELASLVSGTIDRWDAVETSRRLELLLGPDLQYIRINGTIVGGLAGLALHAISVAAG
ncbi:MAG TPA: DUF445 domain-containing protein [Acidimicrobiales bacterium]|jgi:uncharacterized membrane-anchored protein YjiN (DUF445 family)